MKKTRHYNRPIKFLLATIFICSINFPTMAQELKLKSFKHLKGNTTARIHRKRDVNGQNCAVLIIKHSFKDFEVEAGNGYENLESKVGETWVWLSPDEYRIVIRKKAGYIPFTYNLKDKLSSLETYELIVTDEFGRIEVNAPNAQIWLDNRPVEKNIYSFSLKEGKYVIKATRERYYEEEKFVILHAGDLFEYNFKLKPIMGSLSISSSPSEANSATIYIDSNLVLQKTPATIPIQIGQYSIKLEKEGYLTYNKRILVNENKATQISARMEVDPTLLMLKHKKKKNFWLTSTIVSTTVGTFSYLQSNKLYSDYQSAGSDADDIHKKIETYDIITPVAFGVAGFSLIEFLIHASKYRKAKSKLNLSSSYSTNGGVLSLKYNF